MATEDELWQLVAGERQGVLATVAGDGRPQLSNVLYVADAGGGVVRMSTTACWVKARNLARDPRAALHVAGRDFWHYAVAEGSATLSTVAWLPVMRRAVSCWRCTRRSTGSWTRTRSTRR